MRFDGKLAMVTGAASGIGLRTARAFAREGAELALVDLDEAGIEAVAREIRNAGGQASAYATDLSRVDRIRALFADVKAAHGRIDALANIAAVYPTSPLLEVTEEHWDAVLGVNLRGVFFCCQEAIGIMAGQGGGAIVNIASGAAFRPLEGMVAYCTSKAGLVGMTRVLALYTARKGVRINTVAPGHTDTEGNQVMSAEIDRREEADKLISGRWLEPEEIADAILFLCSEAARGVHGAILNVNGGNWMP